MRLVVRPNDWGKKVKVMAKGDTVASDRALAYREFWTRFLETVNDRKLGWTTSTKGSPQNWQPLPTGMNGMSYTCTFGQSGLAASRSTARVTSATERDCKTNGVTPDQGAASDDGCRDHRGRY
ncbi:DUF4268 domain-containing protein [Micromonospora sp. MMS20-R2-23]|uniref:DUF4268 domain-containing protein n=1 Tax=Micromonospora antibiotica TaxID=2807623 RepID=A0ABS3V6J3_9ACTN|nr:DUF4268 domain-containing protein [Micromonospora antibiotica]